MFVFIITRIHDLSITIIQFSIKFFSFINNTFRSIALLFLRPAPSQHQHESHAEDQLQHRGHRRCKSNVKKGNYVRCTIAFEYDLCKMQINNLMPPL